MSTPTKDHEQAMESADFLMRPQERHYPKSWYLLCSEQEVARGPVRKNILGKQLVAFRTANGKAAVLEDRCVHMGSSLSRGCVVGETIQCPLHNWRFDTRGQCTHIPSESSIPGFSRQASYPAQIRQGQVYFFNGPEPLFPLPFFEGVSPDELKPSRPFFEQLDCSWFMVGANAVDVQHFSIAHDRKLLATPDVDYPSPSAHRTICRFRVEGDSLADKLTRYVGGATVTLTITDWSSTMIFVHSKLPRAETFGMVCLVPLSPTSTSVSVTVMARRSGNPIARVLLDPIRASIRRILVRKFLGADVHRLHGTSYSPHTLLNIDRQFHEYVLWLGGVIRQGELS